MSFEKDYNKLVKYAKEVIGRERSALQPDDLINEAYLIFHSKGKEYVFSEFTKAMRNYLLDEKRLNINVSVEDFKRQKSYNEQDIVCKKCKGEPQPASCFQLRTKGNGYIYRENTCNTCRNKRVKEWISKNKGNHLAAVKKWNAANPIKVKQMIAERSKQEVQGLTDNYIKKILRILHMSITEENIKNKRENILKKREKKVSCI